MIPVPACGIVETVNSILASVAETANDEDSRQMETIGFRCWHGGAKTMAAAHRHNEIELNFPLGQRLTYLFGGRFVDAPVGRLALFWGALPHQLISAAPDNGGEPSMLWATIPLAWFLQWRLPRAFTDRVLEGEMMIAPSEDTGERDAALLTRWAQDGDSADIDRLRCSQLEIEARVLRLALSVAGEAAPEPRPASFSGDMALAETMARWLAERYASPVDIAALASAVGLHPGYVMTLFKRSLGMTVGQYVARHRISHAQRLLATTAMAVYDIALDCGYSSASQFYVMFQRITRQTPTDFRKSVGRIGKTVK